MNPPPCCKASPTFSSVAKCRLGIAFPYWRESSKPSETRFQERGHAWRGIPIVRTRNRGEVRGWGVFGAGHIEEKVKSAGFLVLLRRRNTVKPLEEARQGGTFGGGGVGGSGSGGRREVGATIAWVAGAAFCRGVEGVGGALTEGFWEEGV